VTVPLGSYNSFFHITNSPELNITASCFILALHHNACGRQTNQSHSNARERIKSKAEDFGSVLPFLSSQETRTRGPALLGGLVNVRLCGVKGCSSTCQHKENSTLFCIINTMGPFC
jgi:hypothetical protein